MLNSKKENKRQVAKTFGERLKLIRKSLNLRQKDFARSIQISSTHLSDIEKDKTKPCHDFFYEILKVYNVNLYYLLIGEGEMFGGSRGEVKIIGKDIKTGNKGIDEFLYYFFNSRMARSYVLYSFWKILGEDEAALKKDLIRSKDEDELKC